MATESKKNYIEGVVKEFIGAHHAEVMAHFEQHTAEVQAKINDFEAALVNQEARIAALEDNALGITIRKDVLVALAHNLIGIAHYQNGWESGLDTVEPFEGN